MRGVGLTAVFALICAAFLGSAAGRAAGAVTGDTCVATGNGTAYTLSIRIPSTAPQQFGFAFAAPGASVTNAVVSGTQGTFSTQKLPTGSSGAWITMTPMQPGSATASLATTGQVTGKFVVTPASDTSPTYFRDPVLAHERAAPRTAFTVDRHATYVPANGVWHLAVAISGPGTVHAASPQPTVGVGSVKRKTTMPLVQSHAVTLRAQASHAEPQADGPRSEDAGRHRVAPRPSRGGLRPEGGEIGEQGRGADAEEIGQERGIGAMLLPGDIDTAERGDYRSASPSGTLIVRAGHPGRAAGRVASPLAEIVRDGIFAEFERTACPGCLTRVWILRESRSGAAC